MRHHHSIALAGVIALAAIGGPAVAGPMVDTTPVALIPVPASTANMQLGGAFSSFDISYADPVTGNVFIADRSNAAVDIFSGSSQTFLGRTPTVFTGQQATTSASGPDGVLTVTSGGNTTLYAGDGNSTLKIFNATNPTSVIQLQSPGISTGGMFRVDEMAYSPSSHQVLAANNADTPAFGNLFNTTNGTSPVTLFKSPIKVAGQPTTGGMEQPAWNPVTGTFFVSIPTLTTATNDPGGLAEIDTSGNVVGTISFAALGISSCSPTGLAVDKTGNMMVGCGNIGTQAILLSSTGTLITTVAGLGGTDELWFDPTTNAFYVTGNGGTNTTRFFDIVNDNGTISQTVDLPTTTSAHSIAVDPLGGDVFVALAGTTTVDPCPATQANPGCIAVFAQAAAAVPEPGSLALVASGLGGLGFAGLFWRRRRQS